MKYTEYLATMAQIAGVIVGFANLANAINRPGLSVVDLQLNRLRIIFTTELGLVLVGFCVLPLLFSYGNFPEEKTLQVLSFFGFFLSAFYNIENIRKHRRLMGKTFPLRAPIFFGVSSVILISIPFLLNAFGLFGMENLVFIYCGEIFLMFALLCVIFCRLLYSVLPKTN